MKTTLLNDINDDNFMDNTKLGGVADTPECCAAPQKDLNRLDRWTKKNCLKFCKGKCKVLHMGKNNPCTSRGSGLTCWEAALWRRT